MLLVVDTTSFFDPPTFEKQNEKRKGKKEKEKKRKNQNQNAEEKKILENSKIKQKT